MSTDADVLPLLAATRPLLTTARFGRALRAYPSVGSTNTHAAAWAAEGAAEGSVVLTELQTAGRGRLGRRWEAHAGQNLMLSVVLRPRLPADRLGLITVAASVAVREAVAAFTTPVPPRIKWPNDLLLDGRKTCGMLLEAAHGAASGPVVILGIGLNVNQDHFPPPLDATATSMLLATGRFTPRAPLLAALLQHLEHHYDTLLADGGTAARQAYTAHLAGQGATVTLHPAAARPALTGRLVGIDDAGALLLDTATGRQTLHAGEVSFRPAPRT